MTKYITISSYAYDEPTEGKSVRYGVREHANWSGQPMVRAAAFTGTNLNLLGEFSQAQVTLSAISYLGRKALTGHS